MTLSSATRDPADVHRAERGDDAEVHGDRDRHAEPEPGGGLDHEPGGHVTVNDYASPIASPGPNQSVHVGAPVTLDASGSSQADGHTLTYLWTQTAGTPVTLSDATAVQPTFTAPNAGTTLKFTVTVTDTQNPNPAVASTTSPEVTIGVGDFASPVASQGPDQTVHRRDVVTLDASGSRQADGHTLTYSWAQTAGTPVTLVEHDGGPADVHGAGDAGAR